MSATTYLYKEIPTKSNVSYTIEQIDEKTWLHKITDLNGKLHEFEFPFGCSCGSTKDIFLLNNKKSICCGKKIAQSKPIICKSCANENPRYKTIRNKMRLFKMVSNSGYPNNSSNPKTKEKIQQNNMHKFGGTSHMHCDLVKEKIRKTNLERLGVEYPSQSKKVREKIIHMNIENRGVENPLQSKDIQNKIKQTLLERYGVENVFQSEEIQNKIKQTLLERYGVDHPSKSKTIKNKVIETFQRNYYDGMSKDQAIALWREEYLSNGVDAANEKYPYFSYTSILKWCLTSEEKQRSYSVTESEVKTQLENYLNIEFEQSNRGLIEENKLLEIDLINHEHKISVEFNGFYWNQIKNDALEKDLFKAEQMRSNGYRHLALDETDLHQLDKIASIVDPNKDRLYARKLQIREIDNPTEFLNEHHLQSHVGAKSSYGLFLGDHLIQCMTFGVPRFYKSIEWELLRLATHSDFLVIGGAQKLFKHFCNDFNPKSIVSYSDNKYFDGSVYARLGMEFVSNTVPNYVWWKGGVKLKRYQTMKHKLPELLGDLFDPELTEKENMESQGWCKVRDLGNKKWIWRA